MQIIFWWKCEKLSIEPKFNPFIQTVSLDRSYYSQLSVRLFHQDIGIKEHASCNSTIKLRNSFVLYTRFYFYKSIPLNKMHLMYKVSNVVFCFLFFSSQLEKRLEMGCRLGSKLKLCNNWTQGSSELSKVSCDTSYHLFSINNNIWNNYQNIS